ncbi:MAG: protein kinase [Planctomycetota bacterium]
MEYGPGQQVGGLSIERELGRGAYGVVYLARDTLLARQVALKVLPGGETEQQEAARDHVLTEARLIANLNSPYVVSLYRLRDATDGGWMLEMECVVGGSLEDELGDEGKPLPIDRALSIFRGICYALKAAHDARVLHGDIKPGNVLFDGDGNVKLTDFGLARMLESSSASVDLEGEAYGTPAYMAPEVMAGESANIGSDLWAAGVLCYQMLTGTLPFPSTNFVELWQAVLDAAPTPLPPNIPDPVADLVLRCLAKQSGDRPASAGAIIEELDRIGSEDTSLAATSSMRERPTNVTAATSRVIGRHIELMEIAAILQEDGVRLLTLTGPGGIGKTTVSRETCRRMLDEFDGGCWFVDLSGCQDADAIAIAVAGVLDVQLAGGGAPLDQVGAVLELRESMLLVLDNFEQVVDAAQATVAAWMERAPRVRFMVTSRALLGIGGERAYEMPPLGAPREGEEIGLDPEAARRYPGVQLFVERAREADARFEFTEERVAAVARICRELDGIPLAIELAAARTRIMRPAQIANKLGERFQLLRSGRSDLTPRQKTLLGAIDWSIDLLEDWERSAFLQACVFEDGFLMEAAEEVIDLSAFDDAPFVMDALQSLREKSLLTAKDDGLETRLSMYSSIRDYGQRKLAAEFASGAIAELEERHSTHYLRVAEEWNADIPGPRDQEALDRISAETGNLGAVQERAARAGDGERAARACLAVAPTMLLRRPPRDVIPRLEAARAALGDGDEALRNQLELRLAKARTLAGEWDDAMRLADAALAAAAGLSDDRARAEASLLQGDLRRFRGSLEEALASFTAAEDVARSAQAPALEAQAIGGRGSVLWQKGAIDDGAQCWSEAEAIARRVGDRATMVRYIINRGVFQEARGLHAEADATYREAEDAARRLGARHWVAQSLGNRANALLKAGDSDGALRCYREAEEFARALGDLGKISEVVGNRGSVLSMRGEVEAALACYREAEQIVRQLGDRRRVAVVLGQRGMVLIRQREFDAALACFHEAEEIATEMGDRPILALSVCRQADTCAQASRLKEARDLFERGMALYDEMGLGSSVTYFVNKVTFARVCDSLGDVARTRTLVEEAQELARALELNSDHPAASVGDALANLAQLANRHQA